MENLKNPFEKGSSVLRKDTASEQEIIRQSPAPEKSVAPAKKKRKGEKTLVGTSDEGVEDGMDVDLPPRGHC